MFWLVGTSNTVFRKLVCIHRVVGHINTSFHKLIGVCWLLECRTSSFCNPIGATGFYDAVSPTFESLFASANFEKGLSFFFSFIPFGLSLLVHLNSCVFCKYSKN